MSEINIEKTEDKKFDEKIYKKVDENLDEKICVKIDEDTMDNMEILAKLALTQEERMETMSEMQKILDYVSKLKEIDTRDVEPLVHIVPEVNVFREDMVTNGDGSEAALKNAPVKKDDKFVVPKTL